MKNVIRNINDLKFASNLYLCGCNRIQELLGVATMSKKNQLF